jgi:uncharacterized cofD-like protein
MAALSLKKKNVVVLGGGNGASTILRALKEHADILSITGIIAMSDSGGSSGFLRQKFGVLPPGDLLRVAIALSKYDSDILRDVLYTKRLPELTQFTDTPEHAANLGNILLTFLQKEGGGIIPALHALEAAFGAVGRVLPITTAHTQLCAELSDGTTISEECALDKPTFARHLTVKRLWLEPAEPAYEGALQALREAGVIFFGPGDLYTSIIATLLPIGVRETLAASSARFVQTIARGRHAEGEPSPSKISGIVAGLEQYLPRPVDVVLYNNVPATPELTEKYAKKGWACIEDDAKTLVGYDVRGRDFEHELGGMNYKKLASLLPEIVEK